MIPEYFSSLFPRTTNENERYNLRNHNDFVNLPRRTVIFERSFVPSVIQLWNYLPVILTNMQSLGMFKHAVLQTMFPKIEVSPYFLHGHRFPLLFMHAYGTHVVT